MSPLHILADHIHWYEAGFAEMGWFAIKAILIWAGLSIVWFPIAMAVVAFVGWWKRG